MACRRVTVEEYNNLPQGKKSYATPEECDCCTESGSCLFCIWTGPWECSMEQECKDAGGEFVTLNENYCACGIEGKPFESQCDIGSIQPGECCDGDCRSPLEVRPRWQKWGFSTQQECYDRVAPPGCNPMLQAACDSNTACDTPIPEPVCE